MTAAVLVAGLGNVFMSDDAFGVEVARQLDLERAFATDAGVKVLDVGIRGVHLAYELLEPYELVVLVDVLSGGDRPGTVYVFEPDPGEWEEGSILDAHDMDPTAVLALVAELGGTVPKVLIVGCEPARLTEGMELTEPVRRAVREAAGVVKELVQEHRSALAGKGNP